MPMRLADTLPRSAAAEVIKLVIEADARHLRNLSLVRAPTAGYLMNQVPSRAVGQTWEIAAAATNTDALSTKVPNVKKAD